MKRIEIQKVIVHDLLILGPGNCGKSKFANSWVEKIVLSEFNEIEDEDNMKVYFDKHVYRILISDNMSYEVFFGGYKPVSKNFNDEENGCCTKIAYEFCPGFFFNMLIEAAKNPEENYALIIEEINRGDAYNIFGEVFQLLDRGEDNYSEYPISVANDVWDYLINKIPDDVKNSETFKKITEANKIKIPSNMFIIATANTDIAGVTRLDAAFLRRFSNIYMDIEGKVYGRAIDRLSLGYNRRDFGYSPYINEPKTSVYKDVYEKFRDYINKQILDDGTLSDDKLLTPYFMKFEKEDYIHVEDFIINVLMYLMDNVFRDPECKSKIIKYGYYNDISNSEDLLKLCTRDIDVNTWLRTE